MTSLTNNGNGNHTVRKRRRVNLACVNCRDRKVKCDGRLPNCATCIRRKETCVYRKIDGTSVAEAYVKDLERRLGIGDQPEIGTSRISQLGTRNPMGSNQVGTQLRTQNDETPISQIENIQNEVEHLLADQINASRIDETPISRIGSQINTQAGINTSVSVTSGCLDTVSGSERKNSLPVATSSLWKILEHNKSPMGSDQDENGAGNMEAAKNATSATQNCSVDAMGAGSPENELSLQQEYYGSSSAMSFMRALVLSFEFRRTEVDHSSFGAKGTGANGIGNHGDGRYRMNRPWSKNVLSDWILPLRRVANHYIDIYFRDVLPLYPFLHQPTFFAAYEAVWKEDEEVEDDLFYCVMNLIFALGVLHERNDGSHSSNLAKKADVFFERSEAKLASEVMSQGSLILVQALLLKSQYLQATRRAGECWITIGLSVRVAQSLGLHLNQVISAKESAIEREFCKRLWHGCVMMDIVASMTFGRPLMGTCHFPVDLPSEANDHLITDEGITHNSHELSQGAFFIESLKLYRVLEKILTTFYAVPGPKTMNASRYQELFSFEEELQEFAQNLPYHLNVDNKVEIEPFQRQATILKARYLHVKVMLHKAVLFPDGFNTPDRGSRISKLCKDVESSSFETCLEAAFELIELLKSNCGRIPSVLPALWYNVYYLYICTIVLLMGKVRASVRKETKLFRIESSWADSVDLFCRLSAESESASRCLQYFESVNEKIENMGLDNGKDNPFTFDSDALLPFTYGESNFFQTEFQFPG